MTTSSGFFSFFHTTKSSQTGERRFAFAFMPPGELKPGAIDDLILQVCKGPLVPDALVLLELSEVAALPVLAQLQADVSKPAQERLEGRIPMLHVKLSLKSGKVSTQVIGPHFQARKSTFARTIETELNACFESGLLEIFKHDEVVLRAPAGYSYQKPSGARSSIFLKPDIGLKSSAEVSFVALALFRKLYSGQVERFKELSTVFVDTMGISPVAYGLRELLMLCGHDRPFHIESFHSYGGFEAIGKPLKGTTLCLISASSSMSLHKRWIEEKEVESNEVVTLLTLKPVKTLSSGSLLAIENPLPATSEGPAQLSIRIEGENFMPAQEPPKKVLLREAHRCDEDVDKFHRFAGKNVFSVYRRPARETLKVRALFVDGTSLLQQPEFDNWLTTRLRHSVKASTRVVIYQNDPTSKLLAEKVLAFCEANLSLDSLSLVASSSINAAAVPPQAGVIVCAAVIGKGSQLLEVSRALRDIQDGPRLFLVGFQVAETKDELTTLDQNLRHSKTVPHEIAKFGTAAIGTQLASSFAQESISHFPPHKRFKNLGSHLDNRNDQLSSKGMPFDHVLLPHGKSVDKSMSLRLGFAFWPKDYSPKPYQAEVLATVAVILQRARELSTLSEEHRLSSRSFRHVVLSPENFTRYNDGVIQGALMRCAYPSELDYRDDYASSDFMKSVILRALARADEEAGEAALEFLLAMSLRRLQLVDQHESEIRSYVESMERTSAHPKLSKVMGYILAPQQKGRSQPNLPF